MSGGIDYLKTGLSKVRTSKEFKAWAKFDLRRYIPHAAFLGTVGNLYALGSMPTHRISVDFPLQMVEELKTPSGAILDPLMHGWFRTARLRYVKVGRDSAAADQAQWNEVLREFGFRSMLIHGVLNHNSRRFSLFQFANPYDGGSAEVAELVNELIEPMNEAAWATVDGRLAPSSRRLVGHPLNSLTATEVEIVGMLAQGLSNKEIAKLRGVSGSTVKTQVSRTGVKLGACRRAEIVAIGMSMFSPLPPQSVVHYDN